MYRRSLLAAVAGLSGCAGLGSTPGGGSDQSPPGGGSGDGSTGTAESADGPSNATAAATPAATTTPDGTPSPAELGRMDVDELLALAREQAGQAVEAYAGGSGSLTAVTAATDSFDPSAVIEALYGARAAYEAADRQGLSDDQERAIRLLRRFETVLRLAIDVQVHLGEAHASLVRLVDAIEYVDAETTASLVERTASRQTRAGEALSRLSQDRYADSVGVTDRLTRDEYTAKRRQFGTETEVLGDLVDALEPVVEGVRLLSQARGKRQSGSPYAAATLSRDAETSLSRGRVALDGVASSVPPSGHGFVAISSTLTRTVADQRLEARRFHEDLS